MRKDQVKHQLVRLGQVAYYEQGSGKPFLFLHGFPDTPLTFAAQVDYFSSRGYRCIVPYMPGYGETSVPAKGGTSQLAIATMMSQFVQQIAPDQPVTIYGHDWGSIVAQLMVALAGTGESNVKIDKLILGAVPPIRSFLRNMNFAQLVRSRYMYYFQLPGVINYIKSQHLAYIRTLWMRWSPSISLLHPQIDEAVTTLKAGDALKQGISYYRNLLNPVRALYMGSLVKQMKLMLQMQSTPCLFVVGLQDNCIGEEMFRGCESDYPHQATRRQDFPDAGHFLHLEQPESFNQAVDQFLAPDRVVHSEKRA